MDNILLSFPRSGNTWVRYALECVTGRPTSIEMVKNCQAGIKTRGSISSTTDLKVDVLKKCIAIKRHRADNHWDSFSKDNINLILLVRHYKEAIIRHLISTDYKDPSIIDKTINDYLHCLEFYDKFDGNKILIYYEDLIINQKREFKRIFDFLGVKDSVGFLKNIQKYRLLSIKSYEPGSLTQGAANKLHFHSRNFRHLAAIIDSKVKDSLVLNKYMKRFIMM